MVANQLSVDLEALDAIPYAGVGTFLRHATVLRNGIKTHVRSLVGVLRARRQRGFEGFPEGRRSHPLCVAPDETLGRFVITGRQQSESKFDRALERACHRSRGGETEVSEDEWRYIFPNTQVARLIAGEGSARGETCFADRASIEPTDSREHAISATKVHVLNLNSLAKCPQLY